MGRSFDRGVLRPMSVAAQLTGWRRNKLRYLSRSTGGLSPLSRGHRTNGAPRLRDAGATGSSGPEESAAQTGHANGRLPAARSVAAVLLEDVVAELDELVIHLMHYLVR